NLAVTLPS
ncbi:hypothetical protein ATCVOR07043_143R, partial [Acanthocystis turfacea Chlorella virus OR0704.3]